MERTWKRKRVITPFILVMLLPAVASAQTGSIAGVVKDTTGAVLPGVTVEAASPALIEKVRTVVTDEQGQFKVVDLRPGVYAVTFSLAGFGTVKRDGIELTTSFTALVNAELSVGSVSETITVSGTSPVVDVQNTVQERVMTRDVLDTVPTSKTLQDTAALVPGMVVSGFGNAQDVGGQVGDNQVQMQIHDSRTGDTVYQMDGMRFNNLSTGGSFGQVSQNISTQEVSVETGAISAEVESGGVRINLVPKAGGNTYAGSVIGDWTDHTMQSNNLTDALKARGLLSVGSVNTVWDSAAGLGGPIKKDKLWFYGSGSYNYRENFLAGVFYQQDPLGYAYAPNPSRPGPEDLWDRVVGGRVTWQATAKNRFNVYDDDRGRCVCHWYLTSLVAPEASSVQGVTANFLRQVTWTSPLTQKLLLEAGYSLFVHDWTSLLQPSVSSTTYAVTDLATGWHLRAPSSIGIGNDYNSFPVARGSVSYITGSHALKVGFTMNQGTEHTVMRFNNDANLTMNNGVPVSVTYQAPIDRTDQVKVNLGIFAQDQWTMHRLTLNLGLRFDYMHSVVPAQSVAASLYVPARQFGQVDCVPCWKDLNPRVGGAYDLFGNGKTAIKASLSRYDVSQIVQLAIANNPITTTSNSATRAWTDRNGDFIPQGDPLNPLPNGELTGPLTNPNFGKVVVTTAYDPAVLNGWFKRPYDWEFTVGVQHELRPRVALNAAYIRRWYGNFTVTDNLLQTPTNYDPYCVTAPVNGGLPGGGGNQICGLYNITPTLFSATTNNLVTFADHYGTQREIYDGFDFTVNARLRNGILLAGGLNAGRTMTDACFVVDSPQQLQFCKVTPPFQPQLKLLGAYPLPLGLQVAGTFQSLPGPNILATWAAPVAAISPSLGRPLAGNVATASISLIQPGTLYGDRLNQLDFRLLKNFTLKGPQRKLQVMLDLYNAFNASPVVFQNNTYGPQWQVPTSILSGRLVKFGAQLNF
jgi:hypothetical protein